MAEIYLSTGTSASYEKGDIVEVLEDGQYGGNQAKSPDFFVVRIPDKTCGELQYLKEPVIDVEGEVIKKRKYGIDYISVLGQARVDEITGLSEWIVDDVSLSDVVEKQ